LIFSDFSTNCLWKIAVKSSPRLRTKCVDFNAKCDPR